VGNVCRASEVEESAVGEEQQNETLRPPQLIIRVRPPKLLSAVSLLSVRSAAPRVALPSEFSRRIAFRPLVFSPKHVNDTVRSAHLECEIHVADGAV
jgi:hypothetical protein